MSGRSLITGAAALVLGGVVGFSTGRSPRSPQPIEPLSERRPIPDAAPPDEYEEFLARGPAGGELGAKLMLRAHRDPWGALAELEAIAAREGVSYCREFYEVMFRAWSLRDLEGALAAMERVVHGPRWAATEEVLNVLFEQDPQRAADIMNEGRHPVGLPRWLIENPIEACKLVPRIASSQDGADHFSFARAWAMKEPEAAMEWAESLTGWQRSQAMSDVVAPWVNGDLQGAMRALDSGQIWEPKLRQQFEHQIASAIGKTKPLEAIERISGSQLVYDRDRWRTISSIVKSWASRDPAAVIGWTQAQEGARYQQVGLQAVGSSWAETDAAAAAEFALSAGARLGAIPELAEAIGTNYLQQDPVAALDWVNQLSPGLRAPNEAQLFRELFHQNRQLAVSQFNARLQGLSPPAVESFSAEYFKADTAAARRWIEGLPRGLAYDSARAGIELAASESGDATLLQLARALGAK